MSDPSLDDISHVLNPQFSSTSVASLDSPGHLQKPAYDLSSKPYIPGYIGLNNIKSNDYLNVIIHSLLHVSSLRNYLLLSNFTGKEPELVKRFAALAKKIWNPRLFKAQVSPHEFLQEVSRISEGRFKITQQGDPTEFLGWLLNRLHKDMGGTKRKQSSESWYFALPYFTPLLTTFPGPIYSAFQGELRMDVQQVIVKGESAEDAKPHFDIDRGKYLLQSAALCSL